MYNKIIIMVFSFYANIIMLTGLYIIMLLSCRHDNMFVRRRLNFLRIER
jgi:hypothetical protein